MSYLKSYLITIVVFFVIDLVWLGAVAKNLYREQLGFLLKDNYNATAAAIFYLFFVAGILFFVINRAVELSSWKYALFAGTFFGFITYSTYDMTNLATIKDWPVMITVIDILWGSFLCAATSLISYLLINYFKV
ncbi:putative membrane protein [Halanaerobium saccharolyticum]|uniref:Putative membrane protein n=1 Tax=Halanaerobium saccharolyticum TaxID=43595 RepID=A0A4R7Z970_9FIRM|nr:DUF2177 family protein [Halanaerobium saccharolyticum]RAK09417.1 putative membrane protein [Halanaerobium saccharolyticum]TDW06274.1 putative membrane protein [Halanaerobium saccharolyticum]TDX61068.1 putative membrane protein [Halanaerobium saccharolyticum]